MPSITLERARMALATTDGLSEVIHPFEGGSHDFVFEIDGDDYSMTLDLGGEEYNVGSEALVSAVRMMPGGSETLAERWPLRYLMEPLNWFFDHKQGEFKMLSIGSEVVSFTKPTAVLFSPSRVLDALASAVSEYGDKDDVLVSGLIHSLDRTAFGVHVPPGQSAHFVDAKPGDRTLGGLSFSGSLLGSAPLEVAIRTHRVVCSNGMISPDSVSRFRLGHVDDADGTEERLYEWLDQTTQELFSEEPMATEFGRIQHLTQHSITEHTSDVLADLFSRLRIPVNTRAEILDAYTEEADGTMYGVVQAMARAAEHSQSLSDSARERLMRDTGIATLIAQDVCESCRRPVTR